MSDGRVPLFHGHPDKLRALGGDYVAIAEDYKTNALRAYGRAWGLWCREHGDALPYGYEGFDDPPRSLGFPCPNCDEDRWFVIDVPHDDRLTAGRYCQCCSTCVTPWDDAFTDTVRATGAKMTEEGVAAMRDQDKSFFRFPDVCPNCGAEPGKIAEITRYEDTGRLREWLCGACGHSWKSERPVDEAIDVDAR